MAFSVLESVHVSQRSPHRRPLTLCPGTEPAILHYQECVSYSPEEDRLRVSILNVKYFQDKQTGIDGVFGVRLLGAALVVLFDSTDFGDKSRGGLSLRSMSRYRSLLPKRLQAAALQRLPPFQGVDYIQF